MNIKIDNSSCSYLKTDLNVLNFICSKAVNISEETQVYDFANQFLLNTSFHLYSNFVMPLLISRKQHYRNIKPKLQNFSEDKIQHLSVICEILLRKTKIEEKEKEDPIKQKLEAIFISTQIFRNKCLFLKSFKQPIIYYLDQFLSTPFIHKIFLDASERMCQTKAIEASLADLIFNASFKWIEKENRLKLLDLKRIIHYCKTEGKKLKSLNLEEKKKINENIKTIIQYCPNLKKLNLASSDIVSLTDLKNLGQLQELNLSDCDNLLEEEFLIFEKDFPQLKILNLSNTKIASLRGLKGLRQLEELNLKNCKNLSEQEFFIIKDNFPNLKVLNLAKTSIKNFEGLKNLHALQELNLNGCQNISLKWQEDINGINTEKCFMIKDYCPNLKVLNLAATSIEDLEGLQDLHQLEELNLSKCEIYSLKNIEKCPNLKKLFLSNLKIDKLNELKNLLKIETLDLSFCCILPEEEFFTIDKICPNLKFLNLKGTDIEGLKGLEGLHRLEFLSLRGCEQFSLADISSMKGNFLNLKTLDLSCSNIATLEGLKIFPNLERLYLEYCSSFNSKALLSIKEECPNLKKLDLQSTQIESLNGLEGLPHLERLNLSYCLKLFPIELILLIKEKCLNLKELNLTGIEMRSLKGLEELPYLEKLNLSYCRNLPRKEIALIQKKCPSLEVITNCH